MTNHEEAELWTTLARQWQDISPLPPPPPRGDNPTTALRSYVDVHSRRLRRLLMLDIGVTLAAVAYTAWNLAHDRGAFSILISLDFAVVLVIVWTFSIVSGRGLWRSSAASTSEYLALARRFALRRLHTAHLAIALLVAQVVAVSLFFPRPPWGGGLPFALLPIVGGVAWMAWAVLARRRALRELRGIDEIEIDTDSMK